MQKRNSSFPLVIFGLICLIFILVFINQRNGEPNQKAENSGLDANISNLAKGLENEKPKQIDQSGSKSEEEARSRQLENDKAIKRAQAEEAAKRKLEEIIKKERNQISRKLSEAKSSIDSPVEALKIVGHYLFEVSESSDPNWDLVEEAKTIASELLERPESDVWILSEAEKFIGKSTLRPQDKVLEYWALSRAYQSIDNAEKEKEFLELAMRELMELEENLILARTGYQLVRLLAADQKKIETVRVLQLLEGAMDRGVSDMHKHNANFAGLAHFVNDSEASDYYWEKNDRLKSYLKKDATIAYLAMSRQLEELDAAMKEVKKVGTYKIISHSGSRAAVTYAAQGQHDKSRDAIRFANRGKSGSTDQTRYLLVIADALSGNYERAIQKARSIRKNNIARNYQLCGIASVLAIHKNDPDQAISVFEQANYAANIVETAFFIGYSMKEKPVELFDLANRNVQPRLKLAHLCGLVTGRNSEKLFQGDSPYIPE